MNFTFGGSQAPGPSRADGGGGLVPAVKTSQSASGAEARQDDAKRGNHGGRDGPTYGTTTAIRCPPPDDATGGSCNDNGKGCGGGGGGGDWGDGCDCCGG